MNIYHNLYMHKFLGAIRSEDSSEIMYARQKLVLMAKAFNLQAIDMVYIKYNGRFTHYNCIT